MAAEKREVKGMVRIGRELREVIVEPLERPSKEPARRKPEKTPDREPVPDRRKTPSRKKTPA